MFCIYEQSARKEYTNWIEYIKPNRFQFDDTKCIQVMLPENDKVVNNWRLSSQVNPCRVICKSFDCILHSTIVYNKVNKSDVDESTPDSSLQHLELNVELEMSGSTRQLPLEVKFEGMREENTSFKFSVRIPRPLTGNSVVVELIML